MEQCRKRNIIIGSLCAVVLLMVVGYAAFSSVLNIKGTTNISSNWNILITDIQIKNIVGGASNASEPTGKGTLTATFKTNLVSPGDSIEYDITVSNQGTLNAVLEKISVSDSNNPAIKFTTTGLTEGDPLNAGDSAVLTVKVEYDSNVTSQPENTEGTFTVTLDYVQNDGSSEVPEPEPITGTIYRYTVDHLKIGDSINGIDITFDPTTLGKKYYLKHDVVNNEIIASYICFVTNTEYCMKPNEFEKSKKLLQQQESWFKSKGGSCINTDFDFYCKGDIFHEVYANTLGNVNAYESGTVGCRVDSNGDSYC